MTQSGLIAVTLTSTMTCFFSFGVFSIKSLVWKATRKEATFLGAGLFYSSPAQITEKYQLSIYPAPWAISIIWPTVLFWNLSAMVYLFYKSVTGGSSLNLPKRTFFMWSGSWLSTTVWTYLFDAERHLGTFFSVLVVVILSCKSLAICCRQWNVIERQIKSENGPGHPFRYLVLEAHAVLAMWSVVAFAISIGYALAYKNSMHQSEPILTGILTPEESATVGALFIFFSFLAWWILDLAYWKEYTNSIKTIYPLFAWVMLSLGLSNYSIDKGMSLNNMLCFGMAIIALIASVTRRRAKDFFSRNQPKPLFSGGHHRD